MDRLLVELPYNRDRCGGITLADEDGRVICGPFAIAARATDHLAVAGGNPSRNPLSRYGDTPTGTYTIRRAPKSAKATKASKEQFGGYGIIILEPLLGDAACAEANGRSLFLITGGDLSASKQLRSTAGALRMHNDDLRVLLKALKGAGDARCEIAERNRLPNRGNVFNDPNCKDTDPPRLLDSRPESFMASTREGLLGSAAGFVAFGLVVSFTLAPGASPAQAAVSKSSVSDDRVALPNSPVTKHGPYVQMAYQAPPQVVAPPVHVGQPPNHGGGGGGQPPNHGGGQPPGNHTGGQPPVTHAGGQPPGGGQAVGPGTVAPNGGGPAPVSSHPMTFDRDKFVQYMDQNAAPSAFIRQGDCAHACRDGLHAGGFDVSNIHGSGKDYGPILMGLGFKPIASSSSASAPANYTPQIGDVAVFAGNSDHKYGHVQVWDGTTWVADFKNPVGKYSPWSTHTATAPSVIYRY